MSSTYLKSSHTIMVAFKRVVSAIALSIISRIFALNTVNMDINKETQKIERNFTMLLRVLKAEQNFETLVVLRQHPDDCFVSISLAAGEQQLSYAQLVLGKPAEIYLRHHFNRELMLLLVCLNAQLDWQLLEYMTHSLESMRSTRTLFLLHNLYANSLLLEQLFQYCMHKHMLNVMAIYENYTANGYIYSYTRFPVFALEKRLQPLTYYPNRLSNLHKHQFVSLPSQIEPLSIVYTDEAGVQHNLGALYNCIKTFTEKLNATLSYKYPVQSDIIIEASVLINLTQNYELDIPMCLVVPTSAKMLTEYSTIVTITTWLPMLPIADYMPRYDIYWLMISNYTLIVNIFLIYCFALLYCIFRHKLLRHAFRRNFNLIDICLNDKILRGFLGLPFTTVGQLNFQLVLLYLLLFIQGLTFNTSYSALLSSYFNEPPRLAQINSFDDFHKLHTKILITSSDMDLLQHISARHLAKQYAKDFEIIPNTNEFNSLLKSLDSRYAYSVRSDIWTLVSKQQQYFSRRLFRTSKQVYFTKFLLQVFPLSENSIYRDAFNKFILEMRAFGFWKFWSSKSFYEMIEADRMILQDLSKVRAFKALTVQDLYYIWLFFIFMHTLASAAFLVEFHWKKYYSHK